MRRFFRFSVRDLLWLTLVAAMGAALFVREQQLQHELQQLQADPSEVQRWRQAAGAMEAACSHAGFQIDAIDLTSEVVRFNTRGKFFGNMNGGGGLGFREPNALILPAAK